MSGDGRRLIGKERKVTGNGRRVTGDRQQVTGEGMVIQISRPFLTGFTASFDVFKNV